MTDGEANAQFARVREVFEDCEPGFGSGGGAFAAYVGGEKVVDLWTGQAAPGRPWEEDTTSTIMSSTKGVTALCVQILVDRGLINVDAPVADYWPEFAQAGKERALVRHVLDHTIGVLTFEGTEDLLHLDGTGFDQYDAIATGLAAARPRWEPGSQITYHAISCGWLAGELVRRITGKTIGTFLQEEVATPLQAEVWIGTPVDQQHRMATILDVDDDVQDPAMAAIAEEARVLRSDPSTVLGQAAIPLRGTTLLDHVPAFMNSPRVRSLEVAAANGTATARGLARMYAMLAGGGELDGVRIVSRKSVDLFSAESAQGPGAGFPLMRLPDGEMAPVLTLRYGLGYALNDVWPGMPPIFGPADEAFGHAGAGGQIAFADPINDIAVAYVRSELSDTNQDVTRLISVLYESAGIS